MDEAGENLLLSDLTHWEEEDRQNKAEHSIASIIVLLKGKHQMRTKKNKQLTPQEELELLQ